MLTISDFLTTVNPQDDIPTIGPIYDQRTNEPTDTPLEDLIADFKAGKVDAPGMDAMVLDYSAWFETWVTMEI